jgi:roadblock/LC7 domain-containing protein
MGEAEDVVKNFGYTASFPSLTSVNGELTYTMVLKGDNGTTKQYAMVNYSNYSIAVSADTLNACAAAYNKAMAQNGAVDNSSTHWTEVDVVVDAIEYIVQGGETTVYIRGNDGVVYKAAFDERFLFADTGDTVVVQVIDDSSVVKIVVYSNLVEIESVDGEKYEEVVEDEINTEISSNN